MSVQALTAVLDHSKSEGSTRLVAIALANRADKHGLCFPSVKTAAQEANVSIRGVQYALRRLEELDELQVLVEADSGLHRTPLYWLKLPGLSGEMTDGHPYFAQMGRGANSAPGAGARSSGGPGADSAPALVQAPAPGGRKPCTTLVQDATKPLLEEPSVNRQVNQKKGAPDGDAAFSQEIFELWKRLTHRNGSTKFSEKRQRVIRMRLKDGHSPEEIRRAIVGCANSDWHMKRGRHANRDGEPHNDLTLILRDTEHVEAFAKLAGDALPANVVPISESAAATTAWAAAKKRLQASIPESTFNIWIAPLEAGGERDGVLVLVDSSDNGSWTGRRYTGLIREALAADGADYTGIEIVSEKDLELQAA